VAVTKKWYGDQGERGIYTVLTKVGLVTHTLHIYINLVFSISETASVTLSKVVATTTGVSITRSESLADDSLTQSWMALARLDLPALSIDISWSYVIKRRSQLTKKAFQHSTSRCHCILILRNFARV
jgi:hypothetical protein